MDLEFLFKIYLNSLFNYEKQFKKIPLARFTKIITAEQRSNKDILFKLRVS